MDYLLGLALYSDYSRKDVHDIFAPSALFTPGSGTWGLHGIVEIPDHPSDFVFFVTFGQHQADHTFDEWITEEGEISWQSQPRQSFQDRRIQQLIHHNEKENSIYLFLRTQRNANYTYLGELKYLAHDPTREKPVYVDWQLMEWPISTEVLNRINLQLHPAAIYRRGRFPIKEPDSEYDHGNTSLFWRGMTWQVNRQELVSQIMDWIAQGLPEEATRYKDWYIDVDGQHISPKWLFHLITGAGYNEFDAPQAREKLSKIGFVAVNMRDIKASNSMNLPKLTSLNSTRLKPSERQLFFEKISQRLSVDFQEIFRPARYRFPDSANWFEIHFPNLKGYYSLRLARHFVEIAYFFPGNIQAADVFVQQVTPHLSIFSEHLRHTITVVSSYYKYWSRLGFELPYSLVSDQNDQNSTKITYAHLLGDFVQATHQELLEVLTRRNKVAPGEKAISNNVSQPQIHILTARIDSIRLVLSGSVAIPSDEVLCDWVHFCYDFGLYKEGQMLFTFVTSEPVNSWYYERTKKLARLCSMRSVEKD